MDKNSQREPQTGDEVGFSNREGLFKTVPSVFIYTSTDLHSSSVQTPVYSNGYFESKVRLPLAEPNSVQVGS